ncbi:Hypothetical protein CINCED_3A014116 [Cinara cedri]|uniref:Uncharacterized protein n=1 Tax=Cinara cedri TaxID=506608 RepID=A0A5E4MU16_9HEMI|nr:Hypothetical protein CINCED_3A014116 [Cinara cedri]
MANENARNEKKLNEEEQNIKNLRVYTFNVFGQIYSKFVQPDNDRYKYIEFCNYFELLEKCKSLSNMLHDNKNTTVCLEDINQEEDLDSENDNYLISNKDKDNDVSEKKHKKIIEILL